MMLELRADLAERPQPAGEDKSAATVADFCTADYTVTDFYCRSASRAGWALPPNPGRFTRLDFRPLVIFGNGCYRAVARGNGVRVRPTPLPAGGDAEARLPYTLRFVCGRSLKMANDEDVTQLRQGVAVWNDWRAQKRERRVDLRGANLRGAYLGRADLRGADLSEADLDGADLRRAGLFGANLRRANLGRARLFGAHLSEARLFEAGLRGADLDGADLGRTNLMGADLRGTDLDKAKLYETVFANVDLSATKGLDTCTHKGPSILDHRTLQRSGHLPLAFLRGCGLPDRLIDYLPSLLEEAIQYYSCFISYSSKDDAFAKRLHADLQNTGVRCWFAPHDLPIGARTWDTIDAAIRVRDKLLLILSRSAIASDWVEDEVGKAFAEERRRCQTVLFPVRIDEAVMKTSEPWAVKLRDQRNIGDFRRWKDHDAYQQAFDRVLQGLKQAPG